MYVYALGNRQKHSEEKNERLRKMQPDSEFHDNNPESAAKYKNYKHESRMNRYINYEKALHQAFHQNPLESHQHNIKQKISAKQMPHKNSKPAKKNYAYRQHKFDDTYCFLEKYWKARKAIKDEDIEKRKVLAEKLYADGKFHLMNRVKKMKYGRNAVKKRNRPPIMMKNN